ncbi:hypothetical protein E8E14_011548 [Neopestalotiopsis sp. 37M]|nr:hypothetical protein E8E14_011548 [Neopestalotiopsis sp. 37M]
MQWLQKSPIGLGHDICQIRRIYRILASKTGPRFINRVLTPQERETPKAKAALRCVLDNNLPAPNSDSANDADLPKRDDQKKDLLKAAQYLAGRFAAKEAVIKAFHQERLNFGNIEIKNLPPVPRLLRTSLNSSVSGVGSDVGAAQGSTQKVGNEEEEKHLPDQPLGSGPPVALVRLDGVQEPLVASVSISHDGDYASAVCFYMPGVGHLPET